MKIAYLHYHLKAGGVTTVIRHQIQAQPSATASVVLSGEAPPDPFPAPVVTVPGIGYDGTPGTEQSAPKIASNIDHAIGRHFGGAGKCDLIHIHNPTLAKNSRFLDIIRHLQSMGYPLLLQIHDFAEDGRPAVYYREAAYPADCHYSVINRRDYHILLESGLDPDGLHFLPNGIPPVEHRPPVTGGDDFILFPVRAIRRKNIGEALLLSLFLPPACQTYITLPPNSPADFPSYRHWQRLATQRCLPVRFEMGLKKDFRTLLQQARHVISTSISEGFGFAFLEPWMADKNLEGRIIPDICRDFTAAGIVLDHLYPQLKIPMDWIGRDLVMKRFQDCYTKNNLLYGVASQMHSAQAFTAPLQRADTLDFGLLDEPLQTMLIEAVQTQPAKLELLPELNPALLRMGRKPTSRRQIAHNRKNILNRYGLPAYGQRLRAIYRSVVSRSVHHQIDKQRLLMKFFNFNNFSLLKWNTYSDKL
ncbi:MAG: hypothetical protein JJV98_18800 [Desulfosarcina sp.]|nr:hypothetical protein [Desulfobacterales bacterium]